MTMSSRQLGCSAFEIHHLRPLSTYSPSSRSMLSSTFVASELATAGSVIAKAERMSPSSSGRSQRSRCSGVPNWARISMLPVSGALQLQASGAIWLCPMTSASGAYSAFLSPAPHSGSGRKRFQSPRSRASSLSSSITAGWACGSPASAS